ncbi:unnamed protein product, partial [Didymodactylos carnosus]
STSEGLLWRLDEVKSAYFFGTARLPAPLTWPYISKTVKAAFSDSTDVYVEFDFTTPESVALLKSCPDATTSTISTEIQNNKDKRQVSQENQPEQTQLLDNFFSLEARRSHKTVGSLETYEMYCKFTKFQTEKIATAIKTTETSLTNEQFSGTIEKLAHEYNCENFDSLQQSNSEKRKQDTSSVQKSDDMMLEHNTAIAETVNNILKRSSSKEKFFFAVDAAHLVGENSIISLLRKNYGYSISQLKFNKMDILPNELFVMIFEYLTHFDILHTFLGINERIDYLLAQYTTDIDLRQCTIAQFEHYCHHVIPIIGSYVKSLKLSNKYSCGQIELGESKNLLSNLPYLESLSLYNVEYDDTLLYYVNYVKLKELTIENVTCENWTMKNDRYLNVFSKHSELDKCHLLGGLSLKCDIKPCCIKELRIDLHTYNDFLILLDNLPLIHRLHVEILYRQDSNAYYKYHQLADKLPYLVSFTFHVRTSNNLYGKFESIIKNLPKLEYLSFILIEYDHDHLLDGYHLQNMLMKLNYLTELKFNIIWDTIYLSKTVTIEQLSQTFQTDFWKQWKVGCYFEQRKKSFILFTLPFLYEHFSVSQESFQFDKFNAFNNVRDLRIYSENITIEILRKLLTESFPNVNSLCLCNDCSLNVNNYSIVINQIHELTLLSSNSNYRILLSMPNIKQLKFDYQMSMKNIIERKSILELYIINCETTQLENIIKHFPNVKILFLSFTKLKHIETASQVIFKILLILKHLFCLNLDNVQGTETHLKQIMCHRRCQFQVKRRSLKIWM